MIENYNEIRFFTPENFKTILLLENGKGNIKNQLQDFVNFCCEQLGVTEHYDIIFDPTIGTDIARCNNLIPPKSIRLNEQIFKLYEMYINDPINFPYSEDLKNKLDRYSFQICSAIVHEIKHAEQYKKYIQEFNELYKNAEAPLSNDLLYIFQKTEREAHLFEIGEIDLLYDFFKQNNYLTSEESEYLKIHRELTRKDLDSEFQDSLNKLVKYKHLKDITGVTPENIEEKLLIYAKIRKLIDRETEFVRERNDKNINENEYLTGIITFDINKNLKYKIKNDDGKWNVYLELKNKDDKTYSHIGFVLDKQECRINTGLFNAYNDIHNNISEKEILKYANAFIELYNTKIKDIKISDFASNAEYETTLNFINTNKKNGFIKDKFILRPSEFSQSQYQEAFQRIKEFLTLDDILRLNVVSNKTKSEISIER